MDDAEALIRAIRAHRDDNTPRLVYADWLDDQGNPTWAEFVRLQCWLSARPEAHPAWEANWQREQELTGVYGAAWTAALGGFTSAPTEFDRGFPTDFYVHDIQEFTWAISELAGMTATDRLRIGRLGDESVDVLGRCEGMTAIAELETNADVQGLTEEGVVRLVQSPHLQQLRRLDLSGTYLHSGNGDAAYLAQEAVLPVLEHVHLGLDFGRGPTRSVASVIRLLESPHRERLRGLEVAYLSEADVRELCRCPGLARLTHLEIGWCVTTDAAAAALAGCPYLDRIELLNFAGEGDDDGRNVLSPAAQERLRERFGDRIVLDPEVHSGGPVRWAYRRRVRTGRRR